MMSGFKVGCCTLNGEPMVIDDDDMRLHWAIIGGTGRGKSKMLELRIRYHADFGHGLILLDPHGTLYEDVLAYATAAGYRDRIVLINANDTQNSVGLNFLTPNGMDVSAQASQVMKAIAKVFGEADGETKPRLERWQRNLLISLIEARLTLADMLDFLSVSSSSYRQAVLGEVSNSYVVREWQGFDAIGKRGEKENLIEAPLNRAAKIILSDPIRRIIGQQQSTIDVGDAVEKGKIVLVNLAPLKVSRECQQILGILLVDQIINYAFQRTRRQSRKPFFVMIDEAAELASDDLPYSLQALRKFGVFFTLCYQTLAQIKRIPGYYENVMTNCDVKIAFKSSRQDSEELIGELFAGQLRGDVVKDEVNHTLLIPRETVREIVSHGHSETMSHAEAASSGSSEMQGRSTGSAFMSSHGSAQHIVPGSDPLMPFDALSLTESDSSGDSFSSGEMRSSGISNSHSDIWSDAHTDSVTRTVVPFYEYIREQELSSRQYYSIEEIKEKYIAWIMCQPQRHAQIKLKDDKAIPILIDYVEEVRAREQDKQRLVDLSNKKYALSAVHVDRLIVERRVKLLEKPKKEAAIMEKEFEDERWQ